MAVVHLLVRSAERNLQTWKWGIMSSLTRGVEKEPLDVVLGCPTWESRG